jgi:hypothetical protein
VPDPGLQTRRGGADMPCMTVRRPYVGTLLIAAACLVLSACGGGQQATSGAAHTAQGIAHEAVGGVASTRDATTGARVGSTRDATTGAPSRAQALAFAHAVNLSAGDIPEASVEKKHGAAATASERREGQACERRIGWRNPHTIVEASSPKLRRGQELEIERITSSVSVLSSERAVARQFALLASPALRECAARILTRNLDDRSIRDASWGHVSVSRLPVQAAGTSATLGIRIVANLDLTFSEVSVPIYVDVLGFAIGRAEVALTAISATQPVPATTERELLALLLARSRSHSL